ncbi:hypothetical protein [Sphingobium yanoikuyae]|uniref:hypothetical protein n=1 Tax=Sphingobium yanoikuyae TaxID=13690 RepID=UPI00345EF506
MSQPENPSAFPGGDMRGCEPGYGMTLRDWFASQFLSRGSAEDSEPLGLPYNYTEQDRIEAMREHWARVAEAAYIAADAMLAERAKGGAA